MEIFKQKKILVLSVVLLVLLNLISIGFFVFIAYSGKSQTISGQDKSREVSDILKKELSLTEKQTEQIKNLRSDFFEKEKVLSALIKAQRDSMNVSMFNKTIDEELVKNLARRIADNQYNMELLRLEQAKEFNSICTPEQLDKFKNLVMEIRDYFKPDNQPKKDNKTESSK
jgi:Spy/CpxP family protein refolding chaperone